VLPVLGFARHTGVRLAEVGFLLAQLAGTWPAAAQVPKLGLGAARRVVAGVLLVVATRWGRCG
jgi:hypothetical protein